MSSAMKEVFSERIESQNGHLDLLAEPYRIAELTISDDVDQEGRESSETA